MTARTWDVMHWDVKDVQEFALPVPRRAIAGDKQLLITPTGSRGTGRLEGFLNRLGLRSA